jgi:hypothetical protein
MARQINLYNPALEERRDSWTLRNTVLGWAMLMMAGGLWAAGAQYWLRQVQVQEHDLAAIVSGARADSQKVSALLIEHSRNPAVAAKISALEQEVKGRRDAMRILQGGGLGDMRGFSEYLRAFARQSFEGIWLTGLKIGAGGRDIAVEGRALNAEFVPNYLRRLGGESIMQGHAFSQLMIQLPKPQGAGMPESKPPFVEFRLSAAPGAGSAPAGTQ